MFVWFPGVDEPRSNQYECNRDRKLGLLGEPHVAPLTEFVKRLRCEHPGKLVPWFDPDEAGVCAPILILMQAPGPGAIRELGGSGFVSANNDDPTAKKMRTLFRDAGVDRAREVVTWNAIPWHTDGGAPSWEVDERLRWLHQLAGLLQEVRVAVLLGRKAATAWRRSSRPRAGRSSSRARLEQEQERPTTRRRPPRAGAPTTPHRRPSTPPASPPAPAHHTPPAPPESRPPAPLVRPC